MVGSIEGEEAFEIARFSKIYVVADDFPGLLSRSGLDVGIVSQQSCQLRVTMS